MPSRVTPQRPPPRDPAAGRSSRTASGLRTGAGHILAIALLLGVGYQLAPLKNGPDLLCGNQMDVPTAVRHPSVDLLDATYSLMPARLRCTPILTGSLAG